MLATAPAFIGDLSLIGGPSVAHAANFENTNAKSSLQKREAWMDASDYSAAHPNVASFVVNGRAQNATNQQIVDYIQERFASHGITNSVAFSGREANIGVSMSFFLNGHAYGPVGFSKMNFTIDEVASHAQGLQAR